MKLKLVVASMSVLGLITCAYADTQTKHRTHHKTRHHRITTTQTQSYKGEGALPVVQPMMMDCQADWYQPMLNSMSQNNGRAMPTSDCHKPLTFAGGANFDYHFGNVSQGYAGENTEKFSVNDAYINAFGNVNQWARAFASLSYNNASSTSISGANGSSTGYRNFASSGEYSAAYNRSANGTDRSDAVHLEQAYVTVGDLNQSPIFVQLGKQFEDFGRYQIHPLTETLTQTMTETLRTSANVGFITRMGLHGSLFAYDNGLRKTNAPDPTTGLVSSDSHSRYAFGASLGFDQPCDTLGYDVGIGYMTDMVGANGVQQAVVNYRTNNNNLPVNGFINRVGSVALYGDVNSGPFDVGVRYTTALQRFNVLDLPNRATNDATQGAKPWAADIKAGYNFNAWNYGQSLYVGYQQTGDAVAMALPSNRWLVGYGVDVYKNTNIGIEWDHDTAYNAGKGGSGRNSNLVGVRAAVKFG